MTELQSRTAIRITLGGVLALLTGLGTASAQQIATLETTAGEVTVLRAGQAQAPAPTMRLQLNDIIVTKQGRASLRFDSDGTVMRIGPESRVQVDENATERDIKLFFGRIWAHVIRWKERPTRFSSGSTIAAIRGTELSLGVASDGNETELAVLEGHVEAETDAGKVMVNGGQVATGAKGRAPSIVRVRPLDAVQWALYYPPVLYAKPGEAAGPVQQAAAKLASGNAEEAAKDLENALKANPNDASALALQSIVSVATNRNEQALATARKATQADPKSGAALIALSYAQQATFDLAAARTSLEKAVELQPGDALAWARLAEIRSSLGDSSGSVAAARKATEVDPNLSRTQTVLGFSQLTQVHTGEAAAAFQKAIALDASDPLPRLGLGLAEIRDGKLGEGSKEIETAVSLDPGQSLLRSYLGKAYFEQKRESLVTREYDLAKQNDPKDPTPYLYDAINKQTTNRPVEALEDVQQAIELNDNRAVYRSRLMLDSDLAARSASLGRIFNDLGFQDVGLVEGWTSVNTDPSDFSGHRLLADNYAALPRHEIARVSELFQSQMLQPLNTTPIQPSLGESNLFLIASQGPSTLAFNEFNPLYNRNQFNVQGGGMVAEDSTWAGEGIASGIYKKLSFSAGYSGYKTDGFRVNNGQDDKIANAFVQVELDPSTSIQGEVRHRKLDAGDLSLNFNPDDFNPNATRSEERTNERFGLRHDFGPAVTFLASYMHSSQDTTGADPNPTIGLNVNLDRHEKADSVEGQLLYRAAGVKVVGGAGYFDINTTESLNLDVLFPGFTAITATDNKDKHTNLYVYSYVPLPRGLTLTLGLSGDLFDQTGTATTNTVFPGVPAGPASPAPAVVLGKKNLANPKAGLSWTLKSGTTLRAAWFKTLTRTLITDQTLEPTQVAGFNQFYDEPSATEAKVWGVALDQKFGRRVFGGAEYNGRDLTIPYNSIQIGPDGTPTVGVKDAAGDEKLGRGYLFVAPHPWLTFGAEYEYEKLDRNPDLGGPYSTVKTQRVPLSARFFHPSGISAFFGVSYFKQDGQFGSINELGEPVFVAGESKFWVVDAAVRYRLPKRYGFLVAGVNNLTDETSTYYATDPNNLEIRPGRLIYGRVVLAFP